MSTAPHRYKSRPGRAIDSCEREGCDVQRKHVMRRGRKTPVAVYRTGVGGLWSEARPPCISVAPDDALPYVPPRGRDPIPLAPIGSRIIHVATLVIYGVGEAGHHHGPKGSCLYSLRPDNVLRPGLWEHPGGKVEKGETVDEAGLREGVEELGVIVQIDSTLTTISMDLVTHVIVLTALAARIQPNEPAPQPLTSKKLLWLEPQQAIDHLPCSPGTYPIHRAVMNWMERHR